MDTRRVTCSHIHICARAHTHTHFQLPPQRCLPGASRQWTPLVSPCKGITTRVTGGWGEHPTVSQSHSVHLEDHRVIFVTQHPSDGTLRASRMPGFHMSVAVTLTCRHRSVGLFSKACWSPGQGYRWSGTLASSLILTEGRAACRELSQNRWARWDVPRRG